MIDPGAYIPPNKTLIFPAYFYCFQQGELILERTSGGYQIPFLNKSLEIPFRIKNIQHIGRLDEAQCYTCETDDAFLITRYKRIGLRDAFEHIQSPLFWGACRAKHLLEWDKNTRFCGHCGTPTRFSDTERVKTCLKCGLNRYPRISPAVIVLVRNDDKMLLAHAQRFPSKFYSVLAGFVEPGESLEDCINREIFEEVGLKVTNLNYFSSQPWPFPDSLMIGFTADYQSGQIKIDQKEISDAGWYTIDDLPPIPPKVSIARRLIDWFVAEQGKQSNT